MGRPCVLALSAAIVVVLLSGCGGAAILLAYIGGGLPPGDDDIGGVVLASVDTAGVTAAQAGDGVPVSGAEVVLFVGRREVGRTLTGPEGYFRFEKPGTGQYNVEVLPPAGSGLMQARRQFQHRKGQQTFLTIVLEPAP